MKGGNNVGWLCDPGWRERSKLPRRRYPIQNRVVCDCPAKVWARPGHGRPEDVIQKRTQTAIDPREDNGFINDTEQLKTRNERGGNWWVNWTREKLVGSWYGK